MSRVTMGDQNSLMIGYHKDTDENPVRGASDNKNIRNRVCSDG